MCVNYPIQREALENSVDKRYNVRSVLCLRFVSSKMCQKICTKITNKRSAYFEASRKRIMSLIDDWVCLLHYTPHSGGSKVGSIWLRWNRKRRDVGVIRFESAQFVF